MTGVLRDSFCNFCHEGVALDQMTPKVIDSSIKTRPSVTGTGARDRRNHRSSWIFHWGEVRDPRTTAM